MSPEPSAAGSLRVVLVAGASGSGKSHLAESTGCALVRLDDFYRDGDEPDLPRTLGIVDWDHVASWNLAAACDALCRLAAGEQVELPVYGIVENARIGSRPVDLSGRGQFMAEGIFAPDLLAPLRDCDLDVVPVWLDRPRTLTFLLRLARDLRERRKPPSVLLRRGVVLWREEPAMRARAVGLGFRPLSMRAARRLLRSRL